MTIGIGLGGLIMLIYGPAGSKPVSVQVICPEAVASKAEPAPTPKVTLPDKLPKIDDEFKNQRAGR